MDSFSISLKIDGKNKKFTAPSFIPGKFFRLAAEIEQEIQSSDSDKFDYDKNFQFVCDVFGNKFDVDDFENGIDARKIVNTVYATVHFVIGNIAIASGLLADGESKDTSKN